MQQWQLYFCHFYFLLLIFHLINFTRTSNTMSNKSDESEDPCFLPDLGGKAFRFSWLSILAMGLSDMDFIMLRCHSDVKSFFLYFTIFKLLNLLLWYITIFDLQILRYPCTFGINPTLSWCMDFKKYIV